MILTFKADYIRIREAMDGDILQIDFDTLPEEPEEDTRKSPCVSISRNLEFPGGPTTDWHDGGDYDGGARILSLTLYRDRVIIEATRGVRIDIRLSLPETEFSDAKLLLERMLGSRLQCLLTDSEPTVAGKRGLRSRSNRSRRDRGV